VPDIWVVGCYPLDMRITELLYSELPPAKMTSRTGLDRVQDLMVSFTN